MAEVLIQFSSRVRGPDDRAHIARVCGRAAEDGMWEGWIEFEPVDGGPVLRSPPESEQPNRADLEYWAGGLTEVYLEGALARAVDADLPDLRPRTVDAQPVYDRPAAPVAGAAGAAGAASAGSAGSATVRAHAVLNPFEVYAQGEDVLWEELGALDDGHLRNIIRAHDLSADETDLRTLNRAGLMQMIVAGVNERVG